MIQQIDISLHIIFMQQFNAMNGNKNQYKLIKSTATLKGRSLKTIKLLNKTICIRFELLNVKLSMVHNL